MSPTSRYIDTKLRQLSIGEATAKILLFNTDERLLERESLIEIGRYPSLAAMKIL